MRQTHRRGRRSSDSRLKNDAPSAERCGIDSVEIARIERLLRETPADGLASFFSAQELAGAGDGLGRAASLAARFAQQASQGHAAHLDQRQPELVEVAEVAVERRRHHAGLARDLAPVELTLREPQDVYLLPFTSRGGAAPFSLVVTRAR